MKLSYKNKKLEKVCKVERAAERELPTGLHVKKLFQRLSELAAFNCLNEVPTTPPFRRHKLGGERINEWAITIKNGWRLCFSAVSDAGEPIQEPDLQKITCVKIDAIEDYHD